MNSSPEPNTFRARYCARHRVADKEFERRLLLLSFPPAMRPMARLILLMRPDAFEADRTVIRRLGATVDHDEFRRELNDMNYERTRDRRTFRSRHGMKASLQRLEKLGRALFHPPGS